MAARVKFKGSLDVSKIAKSRQLADELEPLADAVLASASTDPNDEYVDTLRKQTFVSSGRSGRVSWQVGAAPTIGARVEAKRGTMARAAGEAGL